MRKLALPVVLAALLALPAAASAAPIWNLDIHHNQTNFPQGGTAQYWFDVDNVGADPSSGTTTLTVTLPSGFSLAGSVAINKNAASVPWKVTWSCSGTTTITCTTSGAIPRHSDNRQIIVKVNVPVASGDKVLSATLSGGGAAAPVTSTESVHLSSADAPFGIIASSFTPDFVAADGLTAQRGAGAPPDLLTVPFDFNTIPDPNPGTVAKKIANETVRDVKVELPPGFLGNPTAVGECNQAQFTVSACPPSSYVGRFDGELHWNADDVNFATISFPLYNMIHPVGSLNELAFVLASNPVHIRASLDPANNYAILTTTPDINETLPAYNGKVTVWGVPADPAHDTERCPGMSQGLLGGDTSGSCSSDLPVKPFLTMPFQCSVDNVARFYGYDSWQHSGAFGPEVDYTMPGHMSGCDQVPFDPTVAVAPTNDTADSPSGLDVAIDLPQHEDCVQTDPGPPAHYDCPRATSPLKDATVTLPEGITVNPAAANGLDACTPAEISLGTDDPVQCPDASKIASAEVTTPALPDPIEGTVYLASQDDNPFDSLLAGYIVFSDPDRGILIKVPGEISVDKDTGQLTGTFKDNPQLPFSNLQLHFKAGAHASLITPKTCGDYTTNADFAPWSGNADVPSTSDFTITQGANGGSCPASESDQPNSPGFDAGPVSPVSANYSPFVLHLRRDDGTQTFSALNLTLPQGMTGKLAGTALCPDADLIAAQSKSGKDEQTDPSCPPDSHVGEVVAAAGAGPSPYYAKGDAYLAGPYKGAPVSLATITPAVAGPFDLGTIVVRAPLFIDPTTAQISAKTDPIPTALQGIPTDVRSVDVIMDRPDFTLTGTSCDPASVDGLLTSTLDQTVPLSARYQLSDCGRLGFKPKFALSLKGGTTRNGHPAFKTTISYPTGDYANLSYAQVTLPKQIQLDQSHIQAPCTRPQFAAGQCPAASIIGTATATSPLIDYPLTGPVYLRTGSNPLPDVVLALHGPPSQPIEIDQVGKVDTQNARLRTTFETIPDAPLSSAVVSLVGGSRGLLVNNASLCPGPDLATLRLIAHNNATQLTNPKVAVAGCPKAKKHKHKAKHHKRHAKRHHTRHHRRALR